MAATNGQLNGEPERFINKDTFDPDDEERERELMKSVEVREDMRAMEARKRVSEILNSQAFKDELEDIIESQLKSGPHPASLIALQQISQLILPGSSQAASKLAGAAISGPVIPIADVRGINASVYSKGERILRCKLASVYRLMDLRGWTSSIYNHITVRISQDKEHFLINPFGLLYNEITAGSLVKVDMQGNVVDRGNTALGVNLAGFILHSAIHAARPDIKCIVHTHVPATQVVASMKQGLLPLCQEAMILGPISYHDYYGILVDEEEKESLARNLGPNNKVMFLKNHGVVTCGATVEEAFWLMNLCIAACETQVRLLPVGIDNLSLPSEEIQKKVHSTGSAQRVNHGADKKWRFGELEFEAEMRVLDNAGYRTGYVYKLPVIKCDRTDRQTSEVEYPPATSVLAYYDDMGELKPQIREVQERNRRLHKTDWLNTPNVYKKEEIDEIGTDNPKKITKWVKDESPSKTNAAIPTSNKNTFAPLGGERLEMKKCRKQWVPSTDSPSKGAIMIENRNQFAPQGSNPKEFIQQQRQIKDGYYQDKISAGYQSKILEGGMTEAQLMDANASGTGDHVMVVGAASKGIIKREHQHNAIVYKSYFATNPFDKMTDEELKEYEAAVKRGEMPPKEQVLADLEQQQQLKVETPEIAVSADPSPAAPSNDATDSQASPAQGSTQEMKTPPTPSRRQYYTPRNTAMRHATSKETNIDDALNDTADKSPTAPIPARRGKDQYSSMRAPPSKENEKSSSNFKRSKSERKPKKGDRGLAPQNGEEETHEENGNESPSKDKKDKKKGRMPSFSFGKKKDKKKTQTAV